jgi:hypothetical protein
MVRFSRPDQVLSPLSAGGRCRPLRFGRTSSLGSPLPLISRLVPLLPRGFGTASRDPYTHIKIAGLKNPGRQG